MMKCETRITPHHNCKILRHPTMNLNQTNLSIALSLKKKIYLQLKESLGFRHGLPNRQLKIQNPIKLYVRIMDVTDCSEIEKVFDDTD